MPLQNKTCIVTGGAGGIGQAIVVALAEAGASVVVCDIDAGAASNVAGSLNARGLRAVAAQADVGDAQDMARVVDLACQSFGGVDVLFNNAGIPAMSPLDEIDYPFFERVMRINAFGVVAGTQAAARIMRPNRKGKIINMCSIAGKRGFPNNSTYSASKFAVRALTYAYAQELGPHGITVNAICPGMVETPLWDKISDEHAKRGRDVPPKAILTARNDIIALGRHSQPSDLVGIAIFLASDGSDYITGQCINVDGGMVLD